MTPQRKIEMCKMSLPTGIPQHLHTVLGFQNTVVCFLELTVHLENSCLPLAHELTFHLHSVLLGSFLFFGYSHRQLRHLVNQNKNARLHEKQKSLD